MSEQQQTTSDIELLLATLPPHIMHAILNAPEEPRDLIEVIMDLGRLPEARYRSRERLLSEIEVKQEDIQYVLDRIGEFGEDNRAGIQRTLHRISAIRNRGGTVIGLTCRVGRAVFGTVSIIRDLVETGKSILLLGKPGTGKTTLLRETARVLSAEFRKRVVIVDTSNEIAGDGDIPHPAIGRARRMQVARPSAQHAVMIEAVENHMPEVIVIDEIGTELEAMAARTIAERGVQLIGTAHGVNLDNLMVNPTLSDLIGGIQAVTLGDEEARRRGTQKTVLERKAPPTFDVLVEIQDYDKVALYRDVASAVDALLRGEELMPELRSRDEDGTITVTAAPPRPPEGETPFTPRRSGDGAMGGGNRSYFRMPTARGSNRPIPEARQPVPTGEPQRIFPFGVSRNRLEAAISRLRVPAVIVRDLQEASMVMTLKNYYRQSSQRLRQAEDRGVPVYVLRNNTITQMERQLASIFQLELDDDDEAYWPGEYTDQSLEDVLLDTETAITQVINGEQDAIELPPQNSYIRRLQHQMADRYNLQSESYGSEPQRRVRISR
ncbi:MAG: AAA family ATPase [Chloroflexaceae bacterium]|nr:AAA family ATPase [Chloroflexaceae bacterium]NJO06781.1 AAA family ATPase [Chloroflexaceae bacterium]